jgi:starch phosphorylase
MSKFSSDRTIMQYASQIWDAKAVAPSSAGAGKIG